MWFLVILALRFSKNLRFQITIAAALFTFTIYMNNAQVKTIDFPLNDHDENI